MNGSEKRIELSRWAGSNDGWNASLPLRKDWPVDSIVVDLSVVSFVVPTFLLRLRAFIDFNLGCGRRVEVIAPRNRHVANYLSRMQIAAGLSSEVFPDLPSVRTSEQGDVLVPITCLKSTELCGNGVEHGQNDLGCYLAAQRYRGGNRRTVLSIGDLGIGVPEHMRRIYGDESDRRMLRKALEEGATGTGDSHRGNGIPSVIEEARNAQIRHALLEIHSGRAVLKHRLGRDGSSKTATEVASNKLGTWICLELGPLN